jgi:predicted O-methyltransferase YrrM
LIAAYLQYLFRSGNEHAIHSPFLFELYTNLIKDKKEYHDDYKALAALRKELLSSDEVIEIVDLGAGSRINKSNLRKIKTITKNAEKPEKFGRLFHRLIRRFKPTNVIELGTSLGLTTLFIAKANPNAQVTTFEGCPQTANVAKQNFQRLGVSNVDLVLGNIDDTLPQALSQLQGGIDFLYVDANHRYEPTIRYFELCLAHATNDSVFIFDDIYWSAGMTKAWNEIKAHPRVTLTVDLFWIGLVFFRKEQVKEDFVLRF